MTSCISRSKRIVGVGNWLLLLAYACSGIRVILPGEVGVIRRMGRYHASHSQPITHPPGLVLAWPYPIDQVYRVPIKQEHRIELTAAAADASTSESFDGRKYILTGDRSLIDVQLRAKYRIVDAHDYLDCTSQPQELVRHVLLASLTQTLNAWEIESAMRLSRRPAEDVGNRVRASAEPPSLTLHDATLTAAQRRLSALASGIQILALEVDEIHPPASVMESFQSVHTARIDQDTGREEAEAERAHLLIEAEAMSHQFIAEAHGARSSILGESQGQLAKFQADLSFFTASGDAASLRMYRDAWEGILRDTGQVFFVPPQRNGSQLRLSIPTQETRP